MPDQRAQLQEMVADLELVQVRCYEVRARARDGFASADDVEVAEGDPVDMRVLVRHADDRLGVRVRTDIQSKDVEVYVDIAVYYAVPPGAEYPRDVQASFVSSVAIFTVFPFLRETIADVTRRVGVDPHLLRLLRPGDIDINPEFAPDPDQIPQ
ncbi:hypothetical protein [Actinokineospora sp. NBRC 105648]|uniref:hypothetical protein n=1 Tax=Actinokineospora sp. NBRC 105648 TaxID=3032206 RepID=UPI0024A1D1F9|nr:hypothetical protein [Actinokineospora sp. NBRC 105648]GLZ41112.1 hypothetical protein Acsp05_47360 [Actinokineospora sp. NBRC 105648]